MRIPGQWRARQLRMRWDEFRGGTGMVVMYHRIADHPGDPEQLCVSPQHFDEHLAILSGVGKPIRLTELARRLDRGKTIAGSVVVTFDDGYADNWHAAVPILEKHAVPATVFVSSGQIGHREPFWWDELGMMLLGGTPLPSVLTLDVEGARQMWNVPAGQAESGQDHPRQALYRSVARYVKHLYGPRREAALDQVAAWAGMPRRVAAGERALTPDELRALSRHPLVDIGAHTVSHPVLGPLPVEVQSDEITRGKQELEVVLGRQIDTFSYPFGTPYDYTADTVGLVRQAGFTCACSTRSTRVWKRTDPFQIPRFTVRDWGGKAFAARLREWQSASMAP